MIEGNAFPVPGACYEHRDRIPVCRIQQLRTTRPDDRFENAPWLRATAPTDDSLGRIP